MHARKAEVAGSRKLIALIRESLQGSQSAGCEKVDSQCMAANRWMQAAVSNWQLAASKWLLALGGTALPGDLLNE